MYSDDWAPWYTIIWRSLWVIPTAVSLLLTTLFLTLMYGTRIGKLFFDENF